MSNNVNQSRLAKLLTQIAAKGQHGHRRTPRNYFISGDYCGYYHSAIFDCTFEDWKRLAKLSERYKRFCERVEGWKEVPNSRTHYADNSIEATEVSRQGQRRTVMVLAPGGDACY